MTHTFRSKSIRAFTRATLTFAIMLFALALPLFAQVPADQLAKPPADAQHFTILSTSGTNGKAALWTTADGTRMSRESILLRGQVWELDQAVKLGNDGMPTSLLVRGRTPEGDAAESFAIRDGLASWKSPVDAGKHGYGSAAFYMPQGGTTSGMLELFLQALMASPDKSVALLPGGRARAERLTDVVVGQGAMRKTVTAWAITGIGPSPMPVWTTADGKFFGFVEALSILPVGYESSLTTLDKAQDDALAARSPALAKRLLKTPAGPVAFTHVRAFLDGTHFADDQTVIVNNGVITQVGPATSTPAPHGATIFDGAGKTLVPGLWDSHQHISDDFAGPFLLSLGITSARDPGNNNSLTLARAARRAKGDLLSPKVYPSMLIDGKGPNTAQLGTVVTSEQGAIAAVRRAKAEGFCAIKFYGTYNPAWVAPAAAEAHRLGLHVHGHVPAGMRPSQAIAAGYDELTHIYFVMMEAMPDSVVATSNGINRFEGTGRYAKDVDLNKPPMSSLIATMAARKIASDPTLVVAESLFVPENGDLSPAYAPYVGTLPPATERGFRQGGFAVPKDLTREDYRKSFAKLSQLVTMMHKEGIPIVAGTDGSGLELVRELELYVNAGFTTSEALATATIAPAHMLGVDKTTGSITVGKAADLLLVEGDPSQRIGDLRNTRIVMMGGKLMDADALREASGFSGRPKMTSERPNGN
ncbi:MAG TPA: amidohydrolase family protein [Terriglobales bacterium]|nr:amidohydrolase family protein [Terriglobales bacterium]